MTSVRLHLASAQDFARVVPGDDNSRTMRIISLIHRMITVWVTLESGVQKAWITAATRNVVTKYRVCRDQMVFLQKTETRREHGTAPACHPEHRHAAGQRLPLEWRQDIAR